MQRLPEEVKSLIRTGVALPSVTQVVEELLLNSIDAGASNIAVRVDLSCFKIQVVDNGHGITADQFELLGERYATSKCHSVKDLEILKHYGFRGEALASIKDSSSFLEIVSRAKGSCVTFSKCFQRGKKSLLSKLSTSRPSVGTTVTVHDLFYNLPVRQSKSNVVMEMERIRNRVASLALMWPNIAVSLRNDSLGQVLLQTKKCSSTLGVFFSLFPAARPKDVMEMNAEREDLSMWGFISKECHSQKDVQFIFINKRLVLNSCIHKLVNKIIGQSLITKRREQSMADVLPSSGSPSKHVDLYGMFLLNISCPFDFYDITFDPRKTLVEFKNYKKLSDLIQDMIYSRFRKENLLCDELASLKRDSEHREKSTEIVQPTNSQLKPDYEQFKVNSRAGITGISHSDILFSKPVKKCNKNLLHCFGDSNDVHNDNDDSFSNNEQAESPSVTAMLPVEENQTAVLQNKNGDEKLVGCVVNEEKVQNKPEPMLPQKHLDSSTVIPSSSHHQNNSDDLSKKKCVLRTVNPLTHCSKPPGHTESRFVRKTNKPALSKISMDKSVQYSSTLSCLREFACSKSSRSSTNDFGSNGKLMEHKNAMKPTEFNNATVSTEHADKMPKVLTLTELKKSSKSQEICDTVPRVHTLTELKKTSALKSATKSLENIETIHTLSELKKATAQKSATKSLENIERMTRIHTLSELKKATQSSTNNDIVPRTPLTDDKHVCDENFTPDNAEQTRYDDHHKYNMFNDGNNIQIQTNKTDFGEGIVSKNQCRNVELNNPCILHHGRNEPTVMKRSWVQNRNTSGNKCDDDESIGSNENISLQSSHRNKIYFDEDSRKPNEFPENRFDDDEILTPVELNQRTVVKRFCVDSDVTENSEFMTPQNISTKCNESYHDFENIDTESNVETSQSCYPLSMQGISLPVSNHAAKHKVVFDLPTSNSERLNDSSDDEQDCPPLICSENLLKTTAIATNTVQYHKNSSLNNEEDCHLSAESSTNCPPPATRTLVSYHDQYLPDKEHSGMISHSENIQNDIEIVTCNGENVEKKTGDEFNPRKVHDIVLKGKFNLNLTIRCRNTQRMDASSLNSGKQLSLTGNNKYSNLDFSLKFHPKSFLSHRKRKSSWDFELSAYHPSTKKYHCRLFENDSFTLNENFFSNSLLLKRFLEQYINRPHTGLSENNSTISFMRSLAESRNPSIALHAVNSNVTSAFMSIDLLMKTLYKSIAASQFNSVSIENCQEEENGMELSEIDNHPKERVTGSVGSSETVENMICCRDQQSEATNLGDGSQPNFQENVSELKSPESQKDNECHLGMELGHTLTSPDNLVALPWVQEQNTTTGDLYSDTSKTFRMDSWKNPVFKKHKLPCPSCQLCPTDASVAKACYSFINGLEFTGGMLQNAKVIGQVEMKFIACIIEKGNPSTDSDKKDTMLVLFDQHAVHERIRLEALSSDAEETNKDTPDKRLKKATINPPVKLPISKDDARIMKAFQTEFQRIGVDFLLGEYAHNTQPIIVQSLPLCMTQRDGDGKPREEEEITRNAKDLIQDHIQLLKATNGVCGRIPLAVHRVLCSQACRGAIKFGDPISLTVCKELMKQLSKCCLPFQCAHGRPSVMPLVNLTSLEMHSEYEIVKPRLSKLSPPKLGQLSPCEDNVIMQ